MSSQTTLASRVCALALFALAAPAALAQAPPTLYEREPNDTAAAAPSFTAPARLVGDLARGDADLARWVIEDDAALQLFSLRFEPPPGGASTVTVTAEGAPRPALTLSSPHGAAPVRLDRLLLPAATYVVTVRGAAGPYALTLTATPLDPHALTAEGAGGKLARLATTTDAAAFVLPAGDATVSWSVGSARDPDARWRLDVVALAPEGGAGAFTLEVLDGDGDALASATAEATPASHAAGPTVLPQLHLAARDHLLRLRGPEHTLVVLRAQRLGAPAEAAEVEPNNAPKDANPIVIGRPVAATIDGLDHFLFDVPAADADRLHRITVNTGADADFTVCLFRGAAELLCRKSRGQLDLGDLALGAGEHSLRVQGKKGPAYTLTVTRGAVARSGGEVEPNDRVEDATPIAPGATVGGHLRGDDTDAFRLRVPATARYDLAATGAGVAQLAWARPGLGTLATAPASGDGATRSAALGGLSLQPGEHLVVVTGRDGPYRLTVTKAKAPAAFARDAEPEVEPNDGGAHLDALRFGAARVGFVTAARDVDVYAFTVPGPTAARLAVTADARARLNVRLFEHSRMIKQWAVDAASPLAIGLRLHPGDHRVEISADAAAGADHLGAAYLVALDHADPFDAAIIEPNDRIEDAAPLPADHVARGGADGTDYFALPRLARPAGVTVTGPPGLRVRASVAGRSGDLLARRGDAFVGTLPADEHLFIYINSRGAPGPYEVRVAFDDAGPTAATLTATAAALAVTLARDDVAAWSAEKQTVSGKVKVRGLPGVNGPLALDVRTSDPRWVARLDRSTVTARAGAGVEVGLTLEVAPGAHADRPVQIVVGARAERPGAAWVSATATATARDDAPASAPAAVDPFPDAVLGGVDLARGGAIIGADGRPVTRSVKAARLFEGGARRDRPYDMTLSGETPAAELPTVKLTGDGRAPIVAVILEAPPADLRTSMADFRVWLSDDGARWEVAVEDTLAARHGEQVFALATPRPAAYARLEPRTNHLGAPTLGKQAVAIGTLKVVAAPTAAALGSKPVDVASADRGGYRVWSVPASGWDRTMTLAAGARAEAAWGFRLARAAELTALVWEDAPQASGPRLPGLTFYGSVVGPVGPWVRLGELDGPGRLALPGGTWVRHVRAVSEAVEKRGRYQAPAVRALERQAGDGYRTILGEWGRDRREAGLERTRGRASAAAPAVAGGNQSRAKARALATDGSEVAGRVRRGEVEDFYAIAVPPGDTQLTLRARGAPSLDADFEVSDARGAVIAPAQVAEDAGASVRIYQVDPGSKVFVRVWQPPSSVVFSWDTSGSVAAWVPVVRDAVRRFAEGVTPGQERVHLLPFGGGPLLVDWEDRSARLVDALATYEPSASSASEEALRMASELLAETRGAKAVVLLTDALTPPDEGLWATLAEVRPRVFTAAVAEGLGGVGQERLVSWASVERGWYDGVVSREELEVFFARVTHALREPAGYALAAETAAVAPPKPGAIAVVDERAAGAAPAVAFVVDVSGSMLKPMGRGETRLDVAKRVLAKTLADDVPTGAQVALRLFGGVGGESCGTELAVPLGAVTAAQAAVGGIDAKRYAKTPIAAALAEVGADLGGAKGRRTVVLLTDGGETCGGDPLAAVRALEDKGIDARVNVVGFALTAKWLKRRFAALAEAGGGAYFDAADAEGLAEVLGAAIGVAFVVRDGGGAEVARGVVGGGPVEVAPGTYRVEVAATPPVVFEDVEVRDGARRSLAMGR